MVAIVDSFVNYCIRKGYISHEEAPLLHYNIENKVSTFIIAVPFVLIGYWLTSWPAVLSFFMSFSFLRVHTNGYHSKTFWGCFFTSIFLEVIFLGIFYRIVSENVSIVSTIISGIIIFLLAPYRHPNMNYSEAEVRACSISAKVRAVILISSYVFLEQAGCLELSKGINLGITMTAFLLVLAHIERRYHHE